MGREREGFSSSGLCLRVVLTETKCFHARLKDSEVDIGIYIYDRKGIKL